MAKAGASFVCQACGAVTMPMGRAMRCLRRVEYIVEEARSGPRHGRNRAARGASSRWRFAADEREPPRLLTGVGELDRVLGGGLVPGSAVLVGGDPGIGKSTILLQALAALARRGKRVVYVSGEEAAAQIRLRAARLGLADAPVELGDGDEPRGHRGDAWASGARCPRRHRLGADHVVGRAWKRARHRLAAAGAAPQALVRFAKRRSTAVILVGHVTKDGQIAGPKVVEHMVDTVLYFEGERGHQFRILRAVKNRFGPTDEIGVFEMRDAGLKEVANPSLLFLSDRDRARPASAVFAGMEGTRPAARRDPGPGRALRRSARRAAPWSAGTRPPRHGAGRAGSALRRAGLARTTSISMSPAGCRSANRPPISPRRRALLSS